MKICVFGASSDDLDNKYYEDARAIGAAMAKDGHALIFGAGGHGVMGAAATGAAENGGTVIGVVPKFFDEPGIIFANCSEVIFTDDIRQRKAKMEEMADAFLILPGGIGTFEEFFEVLTLKQLSRHSKPMAMLNTLNYFDPLLVTLKDSTDKGFMGKGCMGLFAVASTPEEALECILTAQPVTKGSSSLADYCK